MKSDFKIEGMTCSACQSHIQKAVDQLEGIEKANVNLLSNAMTVEFDEKKLDIQKIVDAVSKAGYKAIPLQSKAAYKKEDEKDHKGRNLLISAFFTFLVFYLAMGPMMHLPIPFFLEGAENALAFTFTQFLFTLPVILLNWHYFSNGFKRLFQLSPNMDSLIAIGATASMIYGIYTIYSIGYFLGTGDIDMAGHHAHEVYFESAAMILTLVSFGKYLEGKSKKKTNRAIERLMDLSPKTALVKRNGVEVQIPVEEVLLKDQVIVKKGMMVPVDGKIMEGTGSFDQSNVTGESIPVFKQEGETVISSSLLQNGYVVIEATKVGEDTTIQTIIKLVEEASNSKAPISKLADKISGVFVPIVMAIALLSFLVFLLVSKNFDLAFSMGVSVLVIACPCALGLATPVAIMVGTGVAAKNGLLIKDAEILEKTHLLKTVILDKTGTITEGKPKVVDIISFGNEDILSIAYALEQKSEHPLALAIVDKAKEEKTTSHEVEDFESLAGLGICGKINGKRYAIGNQKYLASRQIDLTIHQHQIESFSEHSKTPLYIANDTELIGIITVKDNVKADSKQGIKNLKSLGMNVIMLTGDNAKTAEAIASEVGVDQVISDVLPNEKQDIVASYQKDRKHLVAMVGDGVNDAPALMSADVGIAIGAGSDIAIDSADIVLISNSLNDVYQAVRLSKRVINNIKGNLFWAFFYNCIGIVLASGVFYYSLNIQLNPMIAAAAMSLSSVFVVTNALSLNRFKIKEKEGGKRKMKNITIAIEGMACGHCSARVEKALAAVPGVSKVVVSLEEKNAIVEATDTVSKEALVQVVVDAGYDAK